MTACSCIVCSLHTGFAQIVPNLGLALNTQWCVLASVWPLPCLSSCLQCWLQAFGLQAVHVITEPSESGLCANQQRRLRADVRLLQQAGGVLGVPCDLLPRHPCGQPVCSRPCLSMSMAVAVAVGVLSARVAACSCSTPACRPPSSARSPARCLSRHATPRPPRHLSATQPTNQPTHCVLPIHPSHRRRRPFAVLVFADRARNLISHRRLHHRVRGLQARVHHAAADPNPLSRYDSYATFAAIMVIVYPIGIPAFIFGATLRRLPVAALICTCVALPACLQPCSIGTACVWTSQACAPSWASSTMATTARCGCASFSTRRFSSTACAWWRIIHADHDLAQAQDGMQTATNSPTSMSPAWAAPAALHRRPRTRVLSQSSLLPTVSCKCCNVASPCSSTTQRRGRTLPGPSWTPRQQRAAVHGQHSPTQRTTAGLHGNHYPLIAMNSLGSHAPCALILQHAAVQVHRLHRWIQLHQRKFRRWRLQQ